jgi:hypothetical protein
MNTAILPRLASLHISGAPYCSQESWQIIGNFIRGRMSLQRLCLRLRTSWSDFHEILPIIKDLPALKTLSLPVGTYHCDMEFLALHIPPTIESLYLLLPRKSNYDVSSLEPLVTNLCAL